MGKGNKNNNNNNNEQDNKPQEGQNCPNPGGVIVLGVYIHCKGCADTIRNSLCHFDGVEGIEIDGENHKVIVKGKKADPILVTERLKKKSGKHVELISPIPKPNKQDNKQQPKKEEAKVIEVTLKMYMHCEPCAKEVKQCIHKLPGVQTVDPDMQNSIVKVKGTMSPESLLEFISKRAGRHATIVKVNKHGGGGGGGGSGGGDGGGGRGGGGGGGGGGGAYKNYTCELLHAPQLFSDENPNACSIM